MTGQVAEQGSSLRVGVPGREPAAYEVRVQRGGFDDLATLCLRAAPAHRYAIIADSRVAALYGQRALAAFEREGSPAQLFAFPAGEWNKTREEWARLSDEMLAAGLGRDAVVVALGGGVTGDLAGFVAATYMRGLPLVQVPTTLLAMLDSSVGGKTGLDRHEAKNPIGTFHQPRLVLIDPDLLGSLPAFELASGLAEAVKTAAIADEGLFAWLEAEAMALRTADLDLLTELIGRAVAIKAKVVEEDPQEAGRREVLNFGHTIGHALEALGGYAVLHGEAVASGMRIEGRLGELMEVTEIGTAERLAALLTACGLDRPVEEEYSAEQLLEAARSDKKARVGAIRCVLLRRIGEVAGGKDGVFSHEIPAQEVLGLMRAALRLAGDHADSLGP
ncbi:MAG: 3-dehydroquinate synthase [Gemmatimonadota bacterium]